MPRNRPENSSGALRGIRPLDRYRVLAEEYRSGTGRVSKNLAGLATQLNQARKALAGCVDCLGLPLEPGVRSSFQNLARAERLLSEARERLSEVGWATLEISGEVKRLQGGIAGFRQRFEAHKKLQPTS